MAGVIEDKDSAHNGQPVGRFAGGEDLYKVFKPKELDLGILEEFKSVLGQELKDIRKDLEDFCASERE